MAIACDRRRRAWRLIKHSLDCVLAVGGLLHVNHEAAPLWFMWFP